MKLKAPQGCSVVSVGGCEFPVGEDGVVDIPGELTGAALEHGFRLPEDDAVAGPVATVEEIKAAVAEIERQRGMLIERAREVTRLQDELDEAKSTIADRDKAIFARDDELKAANQKVTDLEANLRTENDRVKQLEADLAEATKPAADKDDKGSKAKSK